MAASAVVRWDMSYEGLSKFDLPLYLNPDTRADIMIHLHRMSQRGYSINTQSLLSFITTLLNTN